MKIILLFLAALASFTVHAQPPSQTGDAANLLI